MAEHVSKSANVGRRVAIIGAGPGGLSAGLALHQAGFDVTIHERHSAVKAIGGAILINPIAVHILRSYGVEVGDLYTPSVQVFRRHRDGRERVRFGGDQGVAAQSGFPAFTSGMMRSELYERMLSAVPNGMIRTEHQLERFEQTPSHVTLSFSNGVTAEADLVIGADGINSVVRDRLFGDPQPFDIGIAVHLAYTFDGAVKRDETTIIHGDRHQFGYSPLQFEGRECVEWWFVEPYTSGELDPVDVKAHVARLVADFHGPPQRLVAATEPANIYRWIIRNRNELKSWSKGRVVLLGDAAHPVSPYAGYGLGMALEDGFFLGRFLVGRDLANIAQITAAFAEFEKQRVGYTNKVTREARRLGKLFHNAPWPVRRFRDFMFDHTPIPRRAIIKQYTAAAYELLGAVVAANQRLDGAQAEGADPQDGERKSHG